MTSPRIEESRKRFDEAMCKYLNYLGLKQLALMNRPDETVFPEFHSIAKVFQDLIDIEKAEAYQAGIDEAETQTLQEIMDDLTLLHKRKEIDDNGFCTVRDLLHIKALQDNK